MNPAPQSTVKCTAAAERKYCLVIQYTHTIYTVHTGRDGKTDSHMSQRNCGTTDGE